MVSNSEHPRRFSFEHNPEDRCSNQEKPLVSPQKPAKKGPVFNARKFLATIGDGRRVVLFSKKQTIFAQGDAANALFYIQEGKVRVAVVSDSGKEATIGILSKGDFFGEGCLAAQGFRAASSTAMTNCSILRIEKKAMMEALHRSPVRHVRGLSIRTEHPVRRRLG